MPKQESNLVSVSLPQVVLLGRPNVGKSTLFNRLIRSNRAITHDRPGITRDRLEGVVRKNKQPLFTLIDTGGVNLLQSEERVQNAQTSMEEEILSQVHQAISSAAALVIVVDGKDGLVPLDEFVVDLARRSNLPILCVVNKVDGEEQTDKLTADFHALGLPLLAVSAAHGYNMPLLVEQISDLLHLEVVSADAAVETQAPLKLAMLGRPNAGKSSLINALVGYDRLIISAEAGTTRDSVDVHFSKNGQDYVFVFVDTAGVRKKTKITDTVERYSVNSALKSTTKAQLTLLTLDAQEGLGAQDKRLIDLLVTRKTPFVILLNKIDLLTAKELKQAQKDLAEALAFCAHIPILPVSAKEQLGLKKILPLAQKIVAECKVRVPTGQLNRAMNEVLHAHQPPIVNHARPKFFYLTQAESEPPTFVFFVSDAERVTESYLRYLERGLRKLFNINHAPIRMRLRSTHGQKGAK